VEAYLDDHAPQLQLEEIMLFSQVMDFSHSSHTSQLHLEEEPIASKFQLQLAHELTVSKYTNVPSSTPSNPSDSTTLSENGDPTQMHIHSTWPFNYV